MLIVENLSVNYGKIEALHEISLQIKEGEIVALIGANGAGKTTLLRTLSGLIVPHRGRIDYFSREITRLPSDRRVKEGIAQVPEGRGLFATLTVEDNLLLGAYTRQDQKEILHDLKEIYRRFPILKEKRKAYAGTLSGGQQQMVAVGRALMSRPNLLLLDEPSMGLAPVIVEEIFETLKKLRESGTTIFLVEQNAHLALRQTDRAYLLENGRIVREGLSVQLEKDERVRAAYLGG
ncbi:ABC transporter ATP-binding protein [Nitratifractor sp.]|uniref:ABC transporter ATP-binding protein n=1 Tax=Nitratifractor sp. TaxID=2268144 RepID=UPI00345DAC45